jgi:hypothetical protein
MSDVERAARLAKKEKRRVSASMPSGPEKCAKTTDIAAMNRNPVNDLISGRCSPMSEP